MSIIEYGPSVGTYHNTPIPGYIVTKDRGRYEFNRLAFLDTNGGCELSQLAPDEVVIAPGLIYRKAPDIPSCNGHQQSSTRVETSQ